MAKRRSAMEAASDRIMVLRAIVASERIRAEANPDSPRNVELFIVEVDEPRHSTKTWIKSIFNELEYLLDHLMISHMAAAFEVEALPRLGTVVGEARKAIEKSRKVADRWPSNLVKAPAHFKGLHDIEDVLSLEPESRRCFSAIRTIRNGFSHGAPIDTAPSLTAQEVRETLLDVLDRVK